MNEVRISKKELLTKLRANKGQHRAIFEEAVEGYRKKVTELLEDHLQRVKEGSLLHVYISLPQPSDHTSDYDRAIAMLDMALEEEIMVDEKTFAQLVMDDWGWKGEFLSTNSAYSMTAERLSKFG